MELRKLQQEQKVWGRNNFGDQPGYRMLLGIQEELGELCHAHLKDEQGIRTNENHFEKKRDAVADIVIYLAGYCNSEEIDLQHTVEEVWEQVKQRNWKKNTENGQ